MEPKEKKKEKYNFKVCFKNKEDLVEFSKVIIDNTKLWKKHNIKFKDEKDFLNYANRISDKSNISPFFDKYSYFKIGKEFPSDYKSTEILNFYELKVLLPDEESRKVLAEITKNNIHDSTRWCYFPKLIQRDAFSHVWKSSPVYPPKYPIYIISKGRWKSRLTSKTLEALKVPYLIVIEPQDYKQYSNVIDKKKIRVLPFKNLGQGTPPARNWVWNDARERGFDKHWILDDNIQHFYRMYNAYKNPIKDSTFFSIIENFMEKYENLGQAGLQYRYFCPDKQPRAPIQMNTRIYSCILMNHALLDKYELQWRGKFQCDTDLSIRILKLGMCTALFNEYLCGKITTMVMKGGNTEEYYAKTNKRYEFAELLTKAHPDVASIVWKFNRWHHFVNYLPFKGNTLIPSSIYKEKEKEFLKYNYKLVKNTQRDKKHEDKKIITY